MGIKATVVCVGALALAIALTSCTGTPAKFGGAAEPTRSSAAAPERTAPGTESLADDSPCADAVQPRPVGDPGETEQLGGVTLAVPVDRGPMPHARGTVTTDADGVPVAYRVAADDNVESVGARFCLDGAWLHWVNYTRRADDTLFVGDTLNLDAHTILSVGNQNGEVGHRRMPEGFVIPPQKRAP